MDDGFAMGYAMGQDSGGNRSNCNDGGFGGANSWIWIIVVFALLFGWGRNGDQGGNSGSGGGDSMAAYIPYLAGAVNTNGAVTRADLCSEFAFNDLNRAVEGVNSGLCDGFYAVNTGILNGFAGVNNAICSLGYNNAQLANNINTTVMQGFNAANVTALQGQNALQTQLAQCCCENREGQAQIRYDMATNTCALQNAISTSTRDVVDSQNAGTRAILDKMCQMEYNALNDKYQAVLTENQGLKFAASQAQQNVALGAMMDANTAEIIRRTAPQTPVPAFPVNPPFPYYGYGFGAGFGGSSCGNSCGCNTGCGC